MNRVIINLEALYHNLSLIDQWMKEQNSSWTVVTKVLCGHEDTLRALRAFGVCSMGESRLENLRTIKKLLPDTEAWYLRIPDLSSVKDVVRLSEVSLNSEIKIIQELNNEAKRLEKIHRIIIMIELGDLREGILPGSLVDFYQKVFNLPHIEVMGIGANLGCLAGVVPTIDQFMQLVLYRELLELKFGKKLPMISGGSSASLPLVIDKQLPKAINHFRIGESIFLGTDLINGGALAGLRTDTVTLEAEIVEIKKKSLVSFAETSSVAPFSNDKNNDLTPGQRGYRALVSFGHLDAEVTGLIPENANYQIAGASSDITVINIGDDPGPLKVGSYINFKLNYAAMLRLMSGKYVERITRPAIKDFIQHRACANQINIAPVLNQIEAETEFVGPSISLN